MCKGILVIPIDKYGSMHSKEPSSIHTEKYRQSKDFTNWIFLMLRFIIEMELK